MTYDNELINNKKSSTIYHVLQLDKEEFAPVGPSILIELFHSRNSQLFLNVLLWPHSAKVFDFHHRSFRWLILFKNKIMLINQSLNLEHQYKLLSMSSLKSLLSNWLTRSMLFSRAALWRIFWPNEFFVKLAFNSLNFT